MNAVDATDRGATQQDVEPPSLLTVILDTHPHAWALLADELPLSKVVASLLVFINAHVAINHANRVAVIASHVGGAEWLWPTPAGKEQDGEDGQEDERGSNGDANKYRPFAQLEHALLGNLRRLLSSTTPADLSATPSTLLAGALTRALAYISKQTATTNLTSSSSHQTQFNYSDPSSAGSNDLATTTNNSTAQQGTLTSRILIISVSGDLADKYIEIMNAIFACQRLSIPIDVLKLSGDTVFLQQAADTTGGIYISLPTPLARAGLLQTLMFAYLPDATARENLIMPSGEGAGVDFRAACFCHKRIVEVGFVCSICLSIFCEPLADGQCLLCGSHLSVGNYGLKPVVVARKRKGKKRAVDGAVVSGGEGTPVPG